ncbi:hypothetical protein PPACK8108_LOCUS6704 [Phakopsora pachyrhizi]|uniref:Uncharacterized protein n=1 Tax=Phakopsora pachyrhizi TaxID=170000 RepID=A0AAV0AT54_PHAPC|nr:hypothetical protein PPACK8108_LOCUS6704 [Phakopsora pachyrhizi]
MGVALGEGGRGSGKGRGRAGPATSPPAFPLGLRETIQKRRWPSSHLSHFLPIEATEMIRFRRWPGSPSPFAAPPPSTTPMA